MFWNKNKNVGSVHTCTIGGQQFNEVTPEQEAFRKNVEMEVERRLSAQKLRDEFVAAPTFKITSSYNIEKNVDIYHLQTKEYNYGLGPPFHYRTLYSNIDKKEVEARFKRLMPKKAA